MHNEEGNGTDKMKVNIEMENENEHETCMMNVKMSIEKEMTINNEKWNIKAGNEKWKCKMKNEKNAK